MEWVACPVPFCPESRVYIRDVSLRPPDCKLLRVFCMCHGNKKPALQLSVVPWPVEIPYQQGKTRQTTLN